MENKPLDRRARYSIHILQTTLLSLLETKPLDDISVTELCAKADINRGTFYKYYRDIDALYEQIEDDFVASLCALLEAPQRSNASGTDIFANVTALLQSRAAFLRTKYRRADTSRLLGKLLSFVLPRLTSQILLRRPDLTPKKARFLGEYIVGGCGRLYELWILDHMTLSAEHLQSYIAAFTESSLRVK